MATVLVIMLLSVRGSGFDISYETPIFGNFLLRDLDPCEVLRGPQGTLYGSGSSRRTIPLHYAQNPSSAKRLGLGQHLIFKRQGSGEAIGYSSGRVFAQCALERQPRLRVVVAFGITPDQPTYVNVYDLDAMESLSLPTEFWPLTLLTGVVEDADTVEHMGWPRPLLWNPR